MDVLAWRLDSVGGSRPRLFEKHGVQVEPVLDEVFDEAIPDLAAGKVDGGFFVIGDLIPLIQNDNLRAVLITDISEGADQIVASSEIRSVADLHGKRIGVSLGTFGEVLVRHLLVLHTDILQTSPKQVRALVAALLDAAEFTRKHPEQAITSIAKLSGMAPEEISFEGVRLYSLEDNRAAFAENPGTDTTSILYCSALC